MKWLKEKFIGFFGEGQSIRFFHSPGRVNLIGEHTDYNGGHVFPCALGFGTYAAARKRDDRKVRFVSGNIDLPVEIELDSVAYDAAHGWANYPKGVLTEISKISEIGGFDFYVFGDIPNGAGLSSSASLELLTAVTVNALFDCNISMKEMVLLSQRAENNFVGVDCGIMDQYAVGFGKFGHAMLIDCQYVSHKYVPLNLRGYKMVIANTNKKRGLVDSEYNTRRSECEKAAALLGVKNLCDIDPPHFEKIKHKITDQTILNRATHVVYENARTLSAVEALRDLTLFGKLMNESHISLRDLYEVTGAELDALAEAAWRIDGVAGSRMTGAGFGGCTISLVHEDAIDNFIKTVDEEYTKKTGLVADFYAVETGGGASEIL